MTGPDEPKHVLNMSQAKHRCYEAINLESFDEIAADLVRALRGRRSQSDLSRRLGYRSNIVRRWEARACFPTAAGFLRGVARSRPGINDCFVKFFKRKPDWLDAREPFSDANVAAFLRALRGKAPISALAAITGFNRYTV